MKTKLRWTGIMLATMALGVLAGCNKGKCDGTVPEKEPAKAAANLVGEDQGPNPWVVDVEELTVGNPNFRAAQWTGTYLQMTVMTIKPGGQIGLEQHNTTDQFIRVESGKARVLMGKTKDNLDWVKEVGDDFAIFIPAGWWHNVLNIGDTDLKVYSIYGPPNHPKGTLHKTYEEAEAAHEHHHEDGDHDHH